jgi:hypothetical protein
VDCLLDPAIRINLDLAAGSPTVSCRQIALEFASPGLLAHSLERSLAEQMKLELIHGPL